MIRSISLFRRTRSIYPDTAEPVTLPDEKPYDPNAPQDNIIFWGTKAGTNMSFLQHIRTFIWFYPDLVSRVIHLFRPISYLVIYTFAFLLIRQTVVYAAHNPQSVLGLPPQQVLEEGFVGEVSGINPLFVTHNQIERDLQVLIFNKLISTSADGSSQPELARSWAVSADGKQYTFYLRKDVVWHDGERFTADDVVFTFKTIQAMKGDDSFTDQFAQIDFGKLDDFTVVMTLPETNPTLMDSIAFPIVPKHMLKDIPVSELSLASFNQLPIGTGPFEIIDNTPTHIILARNERYFKSTPRLEQIHFTLFPTEADALAALKRCELHTLNQASSDILDQIDSYPAYVPYSMQISLRQKLMYFNLRNTGILSSSTFRRALSAATDRDTIAKELGGDTISSIGPITESSWAFNATVDSYPFNISRASSLLDQDGWTFPANPSTDGPYRVKNNAVLSITVSYLDAPSNDLLVKMLTDQWAAVGIKLVSDAQDYERISSETIPRRNFDALLFEVETTPDPDEYNLWHSTKSDYPGLNLSGYAYERVDVLLEQGRTEMDQASRKEDYLRFQKYLMNDMPALFLIHPSYTFIAHTRVKGIELGDTSVPQKRYASVEDWYLTK